MNTTRKYLVASTLLVAPLVLLSSHVQAQQVTFFKKPPTASELRRALTQPSAPLSAARGSDKVVRPAGVKVRGVVWNTPSSGAAASAAQPVASPAEAAQQRPAAGMPINFGLGSSKLAPSSIGFVRSVVEVLRSDPGVNLVIEGHTDSTGSYKRNMVLSWERAMGVYRVLVEDYDIEPNRLQPVGKGPAEPMPGTAPNDGTNRRVQFRING